MIELTNSCCLHHVSGGYDTTGDPNCPGCRGEYDDDVYGKSTSAGSTNSQTGISRGNTERVNGDGTTIGSIVGAGVGSTAGPVGSIVGGLAGATVGYAIDNNLPIIDAEAYGDYIRDVQVW